MSKLLAKFHRKLMFELMFVPFHSMLMFGMFQEHTAELRQAHVQFVKQGTSAMIQQTKWLVVLGSTVTKE